MRTTISLFATCITVNARRKELKIKFHQFYDEKESYKRVCTQNIKISLLYLACECSKNLCDEFSPDKNVW